MQPTPEDLSSDSDLLVDYVEYATRFESYEEPQSS